MWSMKRRRHKIFMTMDNSLMPRNQVFLRSIQQCQTNPKSDLSDPSNILYINNKYLNEPKNGNTDIWSNQFILPIHWVRIK